jgi:citrate synthase
MARSNTTTGICSYDTDRITIRGRNLVTELMGRITFSQMILLQLTGRMPSAAQTQIVDAVLVTIMEHGLVPSAAVTRLTHYGAPESLQGAVAAGLLGVGDRFAGTASECAELLEALVAAPEAERDALAAQIVHSHRERRQPVPGFGHAIHTHGDPRVARLLEIVRSALAADGTAAGAAPFLDALARLERALEVHLGRKLVTNVSSAIAVALAEAGVPAKAMRGIVLTARCAGLAGHLYEEMQRPIAPAMNAAIEAGISYEPPE